MRHHHETSDAFARLQHVRTLYVAKRRRDSRREVVACGVYCIALAIAAVVFYVCLFV